MARLISKRFVTATNIYNAKTWRDAARKAAKGRLIYEGLLKETNTGMVGATLQMMIADNAKFITRMPLSVATDITKYVSTEAYKGLRPSEIAEALQRRVGGISMSRAYLIARTESAKAMSNLTQARANDLGIKAYIWKTAEDQRVRDSHDLMEDVICFWDDPPSPERLNGEKPKGKYHPGNIYNCRCIARPIININTIQFPAKVHYAGKIQTMTRDEFMRIAA